VRAQAVASARLRFVRPATTPEAGPASTTVETEPARPAGAGDGSAGKGVALGIDVGGTGVKAALVDLATAELVSTRVREKTPQPSTPESVLQTVVRVVERTLEGQAVPDDLPIGCGLPGVIKGGVMLTAANLDSGWVGFDAGRRISEVLGRQVHVVNDADAAGLAELAYGAAQGQRGTIVLLTIGTGIGSAIISDGRLVPNSELGHLEMRGRGAETLVSGAARERRKLGWKRWSREFNQYLGRVEFYSWPDLIILGGGVSKEWSRFARFLDTRAPVVQARFLNTSGIIGAAWAAGQVSAGVTP
jgi:polyphosphate glucokinase